MKRPVDLEGVNLDTPASEVTAQPALLDEAPRQIARAHFDSYVLSGITSASPTMVDNTSS